MGLMAPLACGGDVAAAGAANLWRHHTHGALLHGGRGAHNLLPAGLHPGGRGGLEGRRALLHGCCGLEVGAADREELQRTAI